MNDAKVYTIFNMKSKSIKKDDNDDEVKLDEPIEPAELPENIKCDVNIMLDLGTLESGPVRPILKVGI